MRKLGILIWLAAAWPAGAQEAVIESFDSSGKVTFNEVSNAVGYRVEWAAGLNGAWTNFATAAAALDRIPAAGSGMVTALVPMAYRVVAVTNWSEYMVIDISGETNAPSYPVTYLSAVPPGGWTYEHKTTKLVLRRITQGAFTMGSPESELGRGFDEDQHPVTLTKDFYIGVFEVTQMQWYYVMRNWPGWFITDRYERPVERVSYYEIRENPNNSDDGAVDWPNNSAVNANSFVGKLRAKTGLATLDLPTEAQWEYACRAGTSSALNSGLNLTSQQSCTNVAAVGRYWYNGGSEWGSSQDGDASVGTAIAGSYQPNAWGLYDMHGNVLELCLDWHAAYSGSATNPPGAVSGSHRVRRGGAWIEPAAECRSANRSTLYPYQQAYDTGFRLAITLP